MLISSNYTDKCSGCMACKNVCPASCISVMPNRVGNFMTQVDIEKCIHCGLCEKVCPMKEKGSLHIPKKAYVAWSKKINVNRKSASGGVAASIYEYCTTNDIRCIGTRYNRRLKVIYDFVKNTESIKNFTGSRYVYSHMDTIYKKTIMCLERGEKVVFIGLPCHVAALQNVIKKGKEHLICIDLVCHGVVAEKFLAEHIDKMAKGIEKKNIVSIDFREEKNPYGITIKGKKGEILKQKSKLQDEYMLGFCEGFIYCEECYRCQYARKERCSDLTIKDFCGIQQGQLSRQRYGLSNILINTDKGDQFVNMLKPYLNMINYPVDQVIAEDVMLQKPSAKGWKRVFVKLYPLLGFDRSVRVLCFFTILKDRVTQRYRL